MAVRRPFSIVNHDSIYRILSIKGEEVCNGFIGIFP